MDAQTTHEQELRLKVVTLVMAVRSEQLASTILEESILFSEWIIGYSQTSPLNTDDKEVAIPL